MKGIFLKGITLIGFIGLSSFFVYYQAKKHIQKAAQAKKAKMQYFYPKHSTAYTSLDFDQMLHNFLLLQTNAVQRYTSPTFMYSSKVAPWTNVSYKEVYKFLHDLQPDIRFGSPDSL